MIRLIVGADRSAQRVIIERDGHCHAHVHQGAVLERNDHAYVASVLTHEGLTWADIDQFALLAVPHSKTTVRVNVTLLATAAWYANRPLTIIPVDSLDPVDAELVASLPVDSPTEFNPAVLSQLA